MDPWLRVEAACVHGPLLGVEFKLNGAPRVTLYRALHPVGSYTVVMLPTHPHEFRDETGLWFFGSWENGSTNRTRTITLTTDTTVTATLTKSQPGVGPEPPQRKYQTAVGWVRQVKLLRGIKDERDRMAVPAQAQVAFFQDKIRGLLNQLGVYADMHHQYLAYALALDKTQKTLAFMVDWIREHQILRDRFERRDLDPDVLDEIDQLVIFRGAS